MPIHFPPISRRRFLTASVAASAALATRGWLPAADGSADDVDPHRVALLSDTHVAADLARVARNTNMADHFRKACEQVAALTPKPARVLINGDLAYNAGESADYASAVKLLEPLRAAGTPIDIALGNHDHRERFWAGLPGEHAADGPMKSAKHVAVIDTPRARWILLDSLNETLEVRGRLGAEQLKWLAEALDADAKKPVLVMVHHNPEIGDAAGKNGGLADTGELLDLLGSRTQAKALFYGHSHRWEHQQRPDGLHLVNLPATAYVFKPEQPSGWVDAIIGARGATLELRTLDPKHPWAGQKLDLKWRA